MQRVTADEAVQLIRSNDTVVIGGSGGGHAVPEALMAAVERRFLSEGQPRNITAVHPVGLGDGATRGANHFAHEGLLKRIVCGTFVNSPRISDLAIADKIEGYTLPQGALSQLMREIAAGRPGLITKTGLHTFVDPRHGGGRQSKCAPEGLVELIDFRGDEYLFYKPFHIDVCFLRGTTADEDGNITMEQEAVFLEMLSEAQATRRCGGIVIVQVKRMAKRGTLPPKAVKIPGILVDFVVVEPTQWQTYEVEYSPSYAGELRMPLSDIPLLPLDARKVIARRAALELFPGAICNLGSGISTGIANVGAEEGILDEVCFTNEQGLVGGAPASGGDAGAARNYAAVIDQPYQFDFYDGGGLDLAFLSFAEVDAAGNVNVSRFGKRIVGPGGFINISQNAKTVVFSGTFTAGKSEIGWPGGRMQLVRDGDHPKFVANVEQITYSGPYGSRRRQHVLYVTERAVFQLTERGVELIEIAPGADVERDVIGRMGFRPIISAALKTMDPRLFRPEPLQLAADLAARPRSDTPARERARAVAGAGR
ncbi:3-oxoacid CoA-transferase [Bradyrhizobium sp. U87765 SZCCT0131]|uniref:acyl CoA:acetate/3-ketoacid CoA transferase n=1 Tax=unclassified Bradyrhizobium TaxID=2631580 RepID=UPI001BA8DE29|nr:3-oxoacid CoA-transferase [Bradyrhizobium sp. U87765 SZCCT0131]MBR1265380.1 3-oxoacid CoA-transferase [Bradyrhizobium sp. U87765 SZCCT0134]MBR1302841.1 3-oxoacid CoA-transferase [Bradyrhizobium sp. U87765 SZCCT0110]MBR1323539.1 3-oxoacid CoA-transferase [Bradyrhizobium sp. U87765 SZCCT0109]MBR1346770.1 3-oxoacid CoA-transferase [Bradyrhizobium sp. U87765 SZCCT0048]